MKEYILELDETEIKALDIVSYYISGEKTTSRVVFSPIPFDRNGTVFRQISNLTTNERIIPIRRSLSTSIEFIKKVS